MLICMTNSNTSKCRQSTTNEHNLLFWGMFEWLRVFRANMKYDNINGFFFFGYFIGTTR